MRISKDFWLKEFTRSQIASRHGIDNSASSTQRMNIARLVHCVLQPVRTYIGRPLNISSGLRVPLVNKKAGGSRTSDHLTASAADTESPGMSNRELVQVYEKLRRDGIIDYDQLILEFHNDSDPQSGWVHVSNRIEKNRGMSFSIP